MNEREASAEGLEFHGEIADSCIVAEVEKLKNVIKTIRALGFRAVVVQSGRTEWGGGTKLLYVESLYRTYEWLESIKKFTENHIIKGAEEQCKKNYGRCS